jgi:hypothetical protein
LQRLPSSNGPGACQCLDLVQDARETPAHLNGSRQLAFLIDGSADRSSIGLSDDEHLNSMGAIATAGKPP